MTSAQRYDTLETALRLGLPELAESDSVKGSRTAYLKTYAALAARLQPPRTPPASP